MTHISIVIPTYNRPAQLRACLEALARLQYPMQAFEVIVVDDGGDVDLDALIEPLEDSLRLRLVVQQNTGPAGARNNGVAHARGVYIAFTDDDCAPEPEWLAVLAERLEQAPEGLHGGLTINALERNVYSSASQTLIDYLYGYYNAEGEHARFLAANNMAVARSLFESVGGFDPGFRKASGEDRELCDRWRQLGHSMIFVPEARVQHLHALSFGSFCRQHFNYGAGACRFWACRSARGRPGPKLEPLGFYLDLVAYAWKNQLQRPYALTLLLLLSQAANAAGFAAASIGRLWPRAGNRAQSDDLA